MSDPVVYLEDRIYEEIRRCFTGKARPALGIKELLSLFDGHLDTEELQAFVDIGKQVIQLNANIDGECLLTSTSVSIAQNCEQAKGRDPNDYIEDGYGERLHRRKRHLALGDLAVETLYHTDPEVEVIRGTPYRIQLKYVRGEPVDRALDGTRFEPQPITTLVQDNNRPIIKRWHMGRSGEFYKLMDTPHIRALDKMQRQGWKINEDVYNVLMENFDSFTAIPDTDDEKRLTSATSKALDFKAIMKRAGKLLGQTFYQFVECDYRGRVYYHESYLNFQGSDVARGMMTFDKAKRVTAKGLKWLARHTATSYNQSYSITDIPDWCTADYLSHLQAEGLESISVDKMTLEDRERWTYENMDMILANHDLLDCEKSVSFLACCFEWRKYHKNPDNFFSKLPIPIDGSNNGWQHLAAISQDPQAGKLVGLVPVDIQEDFYVKTAKVLIDLLPDWFEEKDMPMKDIRKGISKRGSMTRAYSAGAAKIALNMYSDCRQFGFTDKYGITEDDCKKLSNNLVKAIKDVCPGPLETMTFLQTLASLKMKGTEESTLKWTTPSGFPVEYKAPVMKKEQIKNSMRGIGRISHRVQLELKFPDMKRFASGISPNFIHSRDASHMCMVIDEWDGAFGGVHDSFSTHAEDVDDLQQLTKDVFIRMYSHENNYEEILKQLDIEDFPTPALGSLNINEVNNSDYFFA